MQSCASELLSCCFSTCCCWPLYTEGVQAVRAYARYDLQVQLVWCVSRKEWCLAGPLLGQVMARHGTCNGAIDGPQISETV
jgi:hypothetical protein